MISQPDPTVYAAMIYIDGAEFMGIPHADAGKAWALFDDVVEAEGGDVALMVWQPRWRIWLRERLSISSAA